MFGVRNMDGSGISRNAVGNDSLTDRSNLFAGGCNCRCRIAAAILHIPTRTMTRRRQARKLDPDESDRLYRIARVAGHAVSVFGAEDRATTWLRRPTPVTL